MKTDRSEQLTFWRIGKQQVTADFQGGQIVTDAGLLPVRQFERELGIIAELARPWPDPRSQKFVSYQAEDVLAQQVYQILTGYADCNDANALRDDALFKTLLDISADDEDRTLASGSTLARFQYAYTRRKTPAYLIIDLDATDDPTHGQQLLTGFHGYYDQHQYFPLLLFDGETGFRWAPGCGRAPSMPVADRSRPSPRSSRRSAGRGPR